MIIYEFKKKIGFFTLMMLLILQPFHFIVGEFFPYYRELAALIFFLLFLEEVNKKLYSDIIRPEVKYLLLSLIYLCLISLFDSGKSLYGNDVLLASVYLNRINPTVYILRNSFLYIPMVLYFGIRGIDKREVIKIAIACSVVAPFSVLEFLRKNLMMGIKDLGLLVELGGAGLFYNTYVPYLTFPFVSSLFLCCQLKKMKILFIGISMFLFFYIFSTTSRQSFLFLILSMLLFYVYIPLKNKIKLNFLLVVLILVGSNFFLFALDGYHISDKLLNRYSGADTFLETSRIQKIFYGLKLLSFHEFFWGAGVSSVVVSGPHNDFIRWLQRIGCLGMLLSFSPFLISMKNILKKNIIYEMDEIYIKLYIFLSLFYTLYHSCFGYPREDAYQSLYSFLGLTLWLGYSRKGKSDSVGCIRY